MPEMYVADSADSRATIRSLLGNIMHAIDTEERAIANCEDAIRRSQARLLDLCEARAEYEGLLALLEA